MITYKCVKYIIFDPPWSSEQLGVFGVRVGSRLGVFVVRVASVLNSDLTRSVGRALTICLCVDWFACAHNKVRPIGEQAHCTLSL